MELKTAILIDGSYFLKRHRILRKNDPNFDQYDHEQTAKELYQNALNHLNTTTSKKKDKTGNSKNSQVPNHLYRILYYDCMPFQNKVHNPVTEKSVDFSKTKAAQFRIKFFDELKKKRKLALRLGVLKDHSGWVLKPDKTKDLLKKKISVENLTGEDVYYDLTQKGVDMRIGLDIAALVYKKLVDQIILIAGDSDFVPAAKIARREGVDFILDPMWNHIDESLFEHIDGLKTTYPRPEHLKTVT